MHLAKLFISIIVLWILNIDYTFAFDCSKAFLSVDYVICAYPELLEAEANLEKAYHTLRNSSAQNPEKVKDDQRRWIKAFGPSCGLSDKGKPSSTEARGTHDCVLKALKDRTAYLKSFESDVALPQANGSCLLSSLVPCHAAEYTLGSIILGKSFPDQLSERYVCYPRTEFSNAIQCNLKNSPSAKSGRPSMADTLIKTVDGQILYAYHKSQELGSLNEVANNIISEITNTMRATPRRLSVDGATIAIWGQVKLEEISSGAEEYAELKELIEQKYGLLVTTTGDLDTSKLESPQVYRVIGGDGLVVIVSQGKSRQVVVQRLIVAAGTLAERNFDSQVRQFLMRDQASPPNDFSNWFEMAFMIRRLALNTTPENANKVVDETFSSASSKKYYSHVWAFLPTSVINHLGKRNFYSAADIFREKTEFPEIRDKIIRQLKVEPKEPFSEFLLYTLGQFGEAVKFNPKSPIHTVLVYALGHSSLRQIISSTFQRIAKPGDRELVLDKLDHKSYRDENESENEAEYKEKTTEEKNIALSKKDFFHGHAYENIKYEEHDDYKDDDPSLTQYLNYFNQFPERYNSGPIVFKVPEFRSLTEKLLPQFEEVLKDLSSPHFDDAAYLLGWLAYHRGNVADALDKFEIAIALSSKDVSQSDDLDEKLDEVDYVDYAFPALHQANRILRTLAPEDALDRVQNSKSLSSQSESWQAVLTSFYHSHKYQSVMSAAQRALRNFGISIENLPVTTDPKRIEATFTKLKLADDVALKEIVYLYFSSREIGQVVEMLSESDKSSPSSIAKKTKEVVIKYYVTRDSDLADKPFGHGPKPLHKDLRQSLFVAQKALDSLPRTADFSKLRQWLHYERIRLLAQFDPIKVAAANAEFQNEFPDSSLLDDGIAEQIFAEGVIVGDMVKATATFDTLRQRYPKANAIDNAYSWMAIGWSCIGRPLEARDIGQQTVRLFPLTRHARYARERIRNPAACGLYMWDHWAMRWRERDRIDGIQESLKASGVVSRPSKPR